VLLAALFYFDVTFVGSRGYDGAKLDDTMSGRRTCVFINGIMFWTKLRR
jgi:hypothetical protein